MFMDYFILYFLLNAYTLFGFTHSVSSSNQSKENITRKSNKIKDYWLDVGTNITLLCNVSNSVQIINGTQWIRDGRHEDKKTEFIINGNFVIFNITSENEGNYTCTDEDDDNIVLVKYQLHVRQSPGPVKDVKVVTRSVMAYIMWTPGETGGYDITNYTVQYKLKYGALSNHWQHIHPNIDLKPSATFVDIYLLEPNTSYVFRIWANNKLGAGEVVEVEALTKHDNTEIQLARHLLIGMEDFDTRIWLGAVSFVMGTLLVLIIAILCLFWREFRATKIYKPRIRRSDLLRRKRNTNSNNILLNEEASEVIELIPNIILNPSFEEENSNKCVTSYIGTSNFLYD